MPQMKTWKTRPAYFYLLEVLTKKGDLTDDDLFDQSPQQLLAVLVGGARSGPHPAHIEREARDGCYFLGPEHLWASGLTPDELGFDVTKSKERPLTVGLEPPSNEAVVRVDGEIAPFGSARLETVPFDLFAPLRQGGVAVVLERLCRNERGLDAGRGDGREERSLNGLVDLDPADRQVRHAPSRDELPAGAVIARARVRALVVHGETPPAVPAGSDPLQERRALPERTAWLMGLWADVGTDAGLVGFEGCPVDVAGVMIHDQDRPPVASDATPLDTGSTRLVNDTLVSRAPIDIGASVGRMREHAVDRVVGGCNPPELGPGVPRRLLQRERESLGPERLPTVTARSRTLRIG